MGNANTGIWRWWHGVALLAIVLAIFLIGWRVDAGSRRGAWLMIMILMGLFTVIVGLGLTGLWRGVLADERNKISLSRLQMMLWTILILSGFITAALGNITSGQCNPLSIALPQELWVLMGISTASLVGSPLIRSTKTTKEPDKNEMNKNLNLMNLTRVEVPNVLAQLKAAPPQQAPPELANTVTNAGQVLFNLNPKDISWSDLFRGEETGNAAQVDLGKIQMFFFTLIGVLAYGAALAAMFAGPKVPIQGFPPLDQSLVTLIGISNGGYLINKAVPHSETEKK